MSQAHTPAEVTVAVTTFNRRPMLERAVRSVLDERRVPIRLQVRDNASTDDTEAFMRTLVAQDPRVSYVRNPVNVGAHDNIVASLAAVTTPYFLPLADDDYLLPGFLFDAYAIMQADAELGAAAFYAEARDDAGRLTATWPNNVQAMPEGRLSPADHLRSCLAGSHYSWQAVLWRSSVLSYIGAPFLHTGLPADVDFQAQIFAKFPVYVVKRPGAVFFVHAGQNSNNLSMADVPSWAKLFSRLDATVERLQLFTPEEYLRLRAIMWQRIRPSWIRPPKSPMSLAALARTAVSAGFRLGDWELAFHLVAELRSREAAAAKAPADETNDLPGAAQGRDRDQVIGSRLDLTLRTIEWLQASRQREQALGAQVNALNHSLKLLQDAALTVTADRNRLAAELAALRLRFEPAAPEDGMAMEGSLAPAGEAARMAS